MKISALEEYGLRCMLQLARAKDGKSLTINEIAEEEGLTVANARKLMMVLREAGLVESVRGRLGGYTLKGNPSQITLGQIIDALGGRMFDEEFCGRFTGDVNLCVNSGACSVRSLWGVLDSVVSGVLHRLRLSDLIGEEREVGVSIRDHLVATMDDLLAASDRAPRPHALPVIEA
jgi:Rrf2 family protein